MNVTLRVVIVCLILLVCLVSCTPRIEDETPELTTGVTLSQDLLTLHQE